MQFDIEYFSYFQSTFDNNFSTHYFFLKVSVQSQFKEVWLKSSEKKERVFILISFAK